MAQQATFGLTWFAPLRDSRLWKLFAYLLGTYPIGMFWFVFSVVGVSAGVPLLIVWVGIPILAGVLYVWRFGARMERVMANVFGGVEIASPYLVLEAQTALERLRTHLTDPATWRDGLYLLLLFPLGIVALVVVVLAISIPGSLMAAPFVFWIPDFDLTYLQVGAFSIVIDQLWEAALAFVLGILVAPLALRAGAAGGRARIRLAVNLLGPTKSSALDGQVETLKFSHARGLDAAESERKRIERDLHDGAQQRLVALAMELGRAKEKMVQDPLEAERLVGVAHDHAKTAIVELRDLARGIHPVVLTDRGLDAALSAVAGRSVVPVVVVYDVDHRPVASIESTAYFVASEALANVGKHSHAAIARVGVSCDGSTLRISVADDGLGGARADGNGLRGLSERVESVGGVLSVESPEGGPTVVRAELPCVS